MTSSKARLDSVLCAMLRRSSLIPQRHLFAQRICIRRFSAAEGTPANSDSHERTANFKESYGTKFLRGLGKHSERRKAIQKGMDFDGATITPDKAKDKETIITMQISKGFTEFAGQASLTSLYALHRRRMLEPKLPESMPVATLAEFEEVYKKGKRSFRDRKSKDIMGRHRALKNTRIQNKGYEEKDPLDEAEESEFRFPHRQKSIIEDLWKAEFYERACKEADAEAPDRTTSAATQQSDIFSDVFAASFRENVKQQSRPVLTHELADFENPYMMKRSALDRAYHELCVRDSLDERVLPRVLENDASLLKLKTKAQLPPEAVEPLAAFRGDTRWSFSPSKRLQQKLGDVGTALNAVIESEGQDVKAVLEALPENSATAERPEKLDGLYHPWSNHIGFESEVPRGTVGGTRFGQEMPDLDKQVLSTRYPTLQRVAHTLPKDTKWRAHVAQSIRVLERSKHWDYASKLRAMNSMKEIYDLLSGSDELMEKMDEKLPINMVVLSRRKYAGDLAGTEWVKRFPKGFRRMKTHLLYRKSLYGKSHGTKGKK